MESVLFSLVKAPHYIVLDTNVVLEQIDLLESDGLKNVIVLHTGQLRTVPESGSKITCVDLLLPFISLLFTNTVSRSRACLSI